MQKLDIHGKAEPATLYPLENNEARVEFEKPIKAITPGQSVVFYIEDTVLGGGKIK